MCRRSSNASKKMIVTRALLFSWHTQSHKDSSRDSARVRGPTRPRAFTSQGHSIAAHPVILNIKLKIFRDHGCFFQAAVK